MKLIMPLLVAAIFTNSEVIESRQIDPVLCLNGASERCICPKMVENYNGAVCFQLFEGQITELTLAYRTMMSGRSYREGCPLDFSALRLITFNHWGFDGKIHDGQLVVAAEVAAEVLTIMKELYEARYPLEKARLIDFYDGNDDKSMTDNNSSSFNCRKVAGSDKWSEHSFGQAIDINPLQNPFVSKRGVEPQAGAPYAERQVRQKGMIMAGDHIIKIFAKYGWKWGGNWKSSKDYQHFSKSGR